MYDYVTLFDDDETSVFDQILDISCTPRLFEFVCCNHITNNDHDNDVSFVMCGSFGLRWLFVLLSQCMYLICFYNGSINFRMENSRQIYHLINVCVSSRNGECLCMLVSREGRTIFLDSVFYCNTAVGPNKGKRKVQLWNVCE